LKDLFPDTQFPHKDKRQFKRLACFYPRQFRFSRSNGLRFPLSRSKERRICCSSSSHIRPVKYRRTRL